MSTLPELYSAHRLQRSPAKQGGIFSLSLLNSTAPLRNSLNESSSLSLAEMIRNQNRIKLNSSFNLQQLANTSKVEKNQIPQNTLIRNASKPRKMRSKSNFSQFSSFINKTSDKSVIGASSGATSARQIAIISDQLSYIQNAEQANNTSTLCKHLIQSGIFMSNILKSDNQQLKLISEQLAKCHQTLSNDLDAYQSKFRQQLETIRNLLSCKRKETYSQLKVNKRQAQTLNQEISLCKQLMDKSNDLVDKLVYSCRDN